jgi:hypothetical protein
MKTGNEIYMKKNNQDIPKWLRIVLVILALLALLEIMLFHVGPPRQDFPPFRR